MRWDNLRLIQSPEGMSAPLFEQGAVVRTFDTPEFRGITFYEVRAKSIINRVPEASRVPFRWTINTFRGCSHACVYCQRGETPILLADGRTKPLAELSVGDVVYGTERIGGYRRYVATPVLAHWETVKPAYRITLEDGTELVASADHRYLTDRGWKFVAGTEHGRARRPFLTTNNELIGTGRFTSAPQPSQEYRRGYLCGMVRGDGHIGSYSYMRAGRGVDGHHRFRLALVDLEPLRRTQRYLAEIGVRTDEFPFQQAVGYRKPLVGIGHQSAAGAAAIWDAIAWPDRPADEWGKGFLAGIFDAEGSHCRGILRISNADPEIVRRTADALARFRFAGVVEPAHPNGGRSIRVAGGLREHLRFFHTADPATTRKRTIDGMAVKSNAPLRVTSIQPVGTDLPMFDITTGTGDFIADGVVSHNCFARNTHTYLDLDYGEDFNRQIVVKVNAPELVRKELTHPRWRGEHIAMGTNVDNYQRAEGRYRLMRGVLEALRDGRNPFSILTKGSLILRDVDLLQQCADVTDVGTNVSVGFVDRELWRAIEPGTPSPQKRLDVCRTLNDAGVQCGVLMAPIIPFLTDSDEHLRATVEAIAHAGATHIAPIVLHLRTGAREWFLAWLREHHPELLPAYDRLYRNRAYAPKEFQAAITAKVKALAGEFGIGQRGPRDARRIGDTPFGHPQDTVPIAPTEQLSLL